MNGTKANKIKALKAARVLIENKDHNFICYALGSVALSNPKLRTEVIYLRSYIEDSLGFSSTLSGWHRHEFGVWPSDRFIRKARIQWIDWMIACYEEKH